MSTRVLHLDSPKIDKAISGAYYLLFNNGGHTGNLVLDGSAYLNYINASGLAVQNNLVVTGSQTTHGNSTFFSFNNLANLSVTGGAYINNLTGTTRFNDVRITGESIFLSDIGLSGNFNATGTTNITGSLYVNGVQITGVIAYNTNIDISLTGDLGTLLTGRGDILVGTGNSGVARFSTGGAFSGAQLLFDPSQAMPFRWGTGVGAQSQASAGTMVTYERLIGSSGALLSNTGDTFVAVATTSGYYKKIEADILGGGTEYVELIATKNGVNMGNIASIDISTYDGRVFGKSASSSINVFAGDVLGLRLLNNGTGYHGTGIGFDLATGQLRASLFFLQTE